jgi:glucokinase
MVVAPEGDPNRFGGRGYLESLASGTGIAAAAKRALESGESKSILISMRGNSVTLTAKMVAEAAQKGDGLAKDIMARAANYLGVGIVNVADTLGLRMFAINGGVSKSGDVFWEPLREAVDKY